jgi:serine/threonine protein phosphatase PrpC
MLTIDPVGLVGSEPFGKNGWILNGASVVGASHYNMGVENQDSIYWIQSNKNDVGILAVADGHGSKFHFRSNIGSRIATKTAAKMLYNFFSEYQVNSTTISSVKDVIRYSLPKRLVKNWNDNVKSHLLRYPFSHSELTKFSLNNNSSFLQKLHTNPHIAYGSTLLTAVLTKNYIFIFQLGDGNILIVDENRNILSPFDKKLQYDGHEQNILPLNFTNSLCMDYSWLEFDVGAYAHVDMVPRLVILSTDGYLNSFKNESGFYKLGIDYLDILDNYGVEYLQSKLQNILKETSLKGSGDDISLGYIYKGSH